MIRIEISFSSKSVALYESTLEEAKAYVRALKENGVEVIKVEYFDKDTREADIKAGRV